MTSLYKILGTTIQSTQEEIKSAYRKLAQKHHPDRDHGDTEKFQAIKEAYEVLSNPDRREKYDLTGDTEQTNVKQLAAGALVSLFNQMLKQYVQDDRLSLLDLVSKNNEQKKRDLERGLAVLTENQKLLNKKINNITTKTGNNLYRGVVQEQLNTISIEIKQISDGIEIAIEIEKLLEDYSEVAPKQRETDNSFFHPHPYGIYRNFNDLA